MDAAGSRLSHRARRSAQSHRGHRDHREQPPLEPEPRHLSRRGAVGCHGPGTAGHRRTQPAGREQPPQARAPSRQPPTGGVRRHVAVSARDGSTVTARNPMDPTITPLAEATAAQQPELRHNVLGLGALIYQGITHSSRATSRCFFIASTVAEFSRFMPSSGGYYSFVTRGLGNRAGFMAAASYLAYDVLGSAGVLGFIGYIAGQFLIAELNVNIPWWILALCAFAIVLTLTLRGVRMSLRTTMILGSLELLIMLALGITFLIHPSPHSSFTAPLNINLAPGGLQGVIAGMVFSILALSGFEAPAPLAQEAHRPATFIRRAVLLSLFVVGIFYIFMAYASAVGWGTGNIPAFASNAAPYTELATRLWGPLSWLVFFAVCNSAIAVGMACTNTASGKPICREVAP